MQRALLEEGVEVDRSTVTRDMVATGARFLARPTTADLTEAHKQTRVELGRDLLQVDPNVIIFTDESLFDCSDPMSHEWVVKGEKPRPRPVAKWTAKVHVWGAIGVGVKRLVVLRSDRVTSESYVSMLATFFSTLKMKGKVFMQDGAPAHSAINTKNYLRKKRVTEVKWPPKE